MLKILSGLKTETGVGLLILGCIGLIVYSSLVVTGWKADESSSYRLVAYFDDSSGLAPSTAVRIAGIKVGTIEDIGLDRGKAKVVMNIYDKYPVYDDATASIRSLGVLGDKYLEITQGTSTRNRLTDEDEITRIGNDNNLDGIIRSINEILSDIKGVTYALNESMGGDEGAGKFNRILENTEELTFSLREAMQKTNQKVDSILENFNNFTYGLNQITQENREGIKGMVDNFEQTGERLLALIEDNRAGLGETIDNFRETGASLNELIAKNRKNINNIVLNFESFSETLERDTPEITGQVRQILEENREALNNTLLKLESATAKLDKAMDSLDKSAENVESITGKIDQGEGTIGKLVNDEETVESVNEALDGLNEILAQANQSRLNMGIRLEYMPKLEEKNTRGAVNLEYVPSPDHTYIFGLSNHPRGKTTETTTTTTNTSNGSSQTNTEEKKEVTDDLLLSLQISQRYYDTRFRVGFFENSVGLGVDQYFGSREQFTLFSEAYHFSRENEGTNLRVGFNWYLWKYFYLTAGGDDVINQISDNRQYFLGFGLDFNEDNLKLLAGSLPLTGF